MGLADEKKKVSSVKVGSSAVTKIWPEATMFRLRLGIAMAQRRAQLQEKERHWSEWGYP